MDYDSADNRLYERLKTKLEAAALRKETVKLMDLVRETLIEKGWPFLEHSDRSPQRPPALPDYGRIPDFVVDSDKDDKWDVIIEIKSPADWNQSDDQLTDFYEFCSARGIQLLIVVPDEIYEHAKKRYSGLGFDGYDRYSLVSG